VNYVIDANTNRYDSVGGNSLTYDAAGNLTTDKDGYRYEYDYENRIVLIKDVNNADLAEFAYDALGRRIRKRDTVADTNNIYYYNDNWQVLCDYNDTGTGGTFERWFAYGNYIDEAVLMSESWNVWLYMRYFVHDHLYSPVALTNSLGMAVSERYEYDAYGDCRIMDGYYAPRSASIYGNPYLFTGRRVDILDNGSLKLQYNRNRYYDQYTGRWLTEDPLGHVDGMNLYEYVTSSPIHFTDPMGETKGASVRCKCYCVDDITVTEKFEIPVRTTDQKGPYARSQEVGAQFTVKITGKWIDSPCSTRLPIDFQWAERWNFPPKTGPEGDLYRGLKNEQFYDLFPRAFAMGKFPMFDQLKKQQDTYEITDRPTFTARGSRSASHHQQVYFLIAASDAPYGHCPCRGDWGGTRTVYIAAYQEYDRSVSHAGVMVTINIFDWAHGHGGLEATGADKLVRDRLIGDIAEKKPLIIAPVPRKRRR